MKYDVINKAFENLRNEYLETDVVATVLLTKKGVEIISAQRAAVNLDEPPAPPQ